MEEFEFDPVKSAANHHKHGIDFVEAQALWRVAGLDQVLAYTGEARKLRTARIGATFWSAVYTERGAALRIISVRRARKDEVDDYERCYPEQGHGDER
ncbi:BrnT family toxin [Tabrizicola sp.]|uniref:BrnT family toxin n=1 Tax=Tabrizicola sp. TaxID=2005166 RepID=UPI00286CD174|nr:BrnT family toxin [Tabrizicola sp.]